MSQRKKIKSNIKFNKGIMVCAKSPSECVMTGCKDIKQCEKMDLYYYPFNDKDLKECFNNNEKRR